MSLKVEKADLSPPQQHTSPKRACPQRIGLARSHRGYRTCFARAPRRACEKSSLAGRLAVCAHKFESPLEGGRSYPLSGFEMMDTRLPPDFRGGGRPLVGEPGERSPHARVIIRSQVVCDLRSLGSMVQGQQIAFKLIERY